MKIDGVDLVKGSVIVGLKIDNQFTNPTSPEIGELVFNTTTNTLNIYGTDNLNWRSLLTDGNLGGHIADDTIHFTEDSIDHINILNVGTTTHVQLDAHIVGTDLNHSASVIINIPSGNISSTDVQLAINELDTDKSPITHDHDSIYLNVTGDTMGGNTITGLADPVNATDAVNKQYVDSGAGTISPGIGLTQNGNAFDVNMGAGITTLPANEVGVDIYPTNAGALILTTDGTTVSSVTSSQLYLLTDGTTLSQSVSGLRVASTGITENELALSIAGNGLTGAAGTPLSISSAVGTAGSVGTLVVNAGDVGVSLGITSTTSAPGDHNHDLNYLPLTGGTLTGDFVIDFNNPKFHMSKSGSGTDEKVWSLYYTGNSFNIGTSNDGINFQLPAMTIDRAGTTPTRVTYNTQTVNFTGDVEIDNPPSNPNHATRKDYVDDNFATKNLVLNVDFDTLISSGDFPIGTSQFYKNVGTAPDGSWATCVTYKSTSGRGFQLATPDTLVGLYTRNQLNSGSQWETWEKLASVSYVDDNFLKLTGGTLSGNFVINRASPSSTIHNTSASVDSGRWSNRISGDILVFDARNDASTSNTNWMVVRRTGTTVDKIELAATGIDLNGAVVATGTVSSDTSISVKGTGAAALTMAESGGSATLTWNNGGGILNFIRFNNDGTISTVPTYIPPVADTDLVVKRYVDTQTGNHLPLTGGTLTGNLTISNTTPALYLDAVSGDSPQVVFGSDGLNISAILWNDITDELTMRQYTSPGSSVTAAEVLVTASGNINLNGVVLTNQAQSTAVNSLVRKDYVDNKFTASEAGTGGSAGSDRIANMVSLTQAEYDAIASPVVSTLYVIT